MGDAFAMWLCREPNASSDDHRDEVSQQVGNQIQLKLVAKGLSRRFGDSEAISTPLSYDV